MPNSPTNHWPAHFESLGVSVDPNPLISLARERLIERLDGLKFEPQVIVDLGAGLGEGALALHQRFPKATVHALEAAPSRLKACLKKRGWWRPKFQAIAGHLEAPPLEAQSVDLLFANLSLIYASNLQETLLQWRELLKPNGLMLISVLGPSCTISRPEQAPKPHQLDVQSLGELLMSASFNEPVLDTDWLTIDYNDSRKLAQDLGQLGWPTSAQPASGEETSKSITTEWEMVYASVWAPDEGQTQKTLEGTIASIGIDQIGRRQR